MKFTFKKNEKIWVVPPTQYKLIKSTISNVYAKFYKIDGYKYLLDESCVFKTKNEAIDSLIKRLKTLKDVNYSSKSYAKAA